MLMTSHATARAVQRTIPPHIVARIYDFGSPRPTRGCVSLTFDRKALALARDAATDRKATDLDRYLGCYVIVGDGEQIVTVARSKRRFRR